MPFSIALKGPLVLIALGVVIQLLVSSHGGGAGAPFIGAGVLWILLTGRSRRTYWNARLRARAYVDERSSRSA